MGPRYKFRYQCLAIILPVLVSTVRIIYNTSDEVTDIVAERWIILFTIIVAETYNERISQEMLDSTQFTFYNLLISYIH